MEDCINPNMARALEQCGFGNDEKILRKILSIERNEKNNGDANVAQIVIEYDKMVDEVTGEEE